MTSRSAVLGFGFFLATPSALQHGRTRPGSFVVSGPSRDAARAIGGVIPNGDPVALVEIPAIGVHEIVVQGTSSG